MSSIALAAALLVSPSGLVGSVGRPAQPHVARISPLTNVATAPVIAAPTSDDETAPQLFSGLKGKAMLVEKEDIPSKAQGELALRPCPPPLTR